MRLAAPPPLVGPPPPPGVSDLPDAYNAVVDLLDRPVADGRDGTAIVEAGPPPRATSYPQLAERVARAGTALAAAGARREDRVVLLADDSAAWVAAALGAMRAGLVAVPVSTLLPDRHLSAALAVARPTVVLVDAERRPVLERLLPGLPVAPTVVALDSDGWAERVAVSDPARPAATLADEPALVLFTSGTTGVPKGAVHAHRDLAVGRCFADVMGYGGSDRLWVTSKFFFAFAVGSGLSSGLAAGASVVVSAGRPTPERIAEVVAATRPTVLSSVPTLYARMLDAALDPAAFASLRAAVSAGEALPTELARRFTGRFGVEVLEHLGSTEYIHPFTANRPGAARPGTVGPVMPGVEALVVAGDGLAAVGEDGDLWVRGPAVMDGYLHRRGETRRTLAHGWLRTGDVARYDGEGYLTVRGRSDDMFLSHGMKVSPVDVEAVLAAHPGVTEVAVAGVPDRDQLMRPWAFVVASSHADDGLVAGLEDLARQRLPGYARPARYVLVDDLPRTVTGKVQRFRLRESPPPGAK